MIEIGRNIRWEIPYADEVEFSRTSGCEFMQIWFFKGDLLIESEGKDKIELIKMLGFPIVIHAVIDLVEFESDIIEVLKILKKLDLKELIVHPNCKIEPINSQSIVRLRDEIKKASTLLRHNGIKTHIENNCRISPINYSSKDVEIIFSNDSDIELLLDIAHVDSYDHLRELVTIKYPKMLHIADKHFTIDHEHLPIGEGELDFDIIFNDILKDFTGKIIIEIDQDDLSIKDSVDKIKDILGERVDDRA